MGEVRTSEPVPEELVLGDRKHLLENPGYVLINRTNKKLVLQFSSHGYRNRPANFAGRLTDHTTMY